MFGHLTQALPPALSGGWNDISCSYTWEIFHPSLLNLYIQVPTLKVQRTPAKSQHEMEGEGLPNAALFKHHLMSKSHRTNHPQPLRAGWTLVLPPLVARELLMPWENQSGHSTLDVTRKTVRMTAGKAARKLSSSTDKKFPLPQAVCVN